MAHDSLSSLSDFEVEGLGSRLWFTGLHCRSGLPWDTEGRIQVRRQATFIRRDGMVVLNPTT